MIKKFLLIVIFYIFGRILFLNADDNTYINSDNIIYDESKNIVELSNNSKINIDNTNLLIDRGIIDYNNDKIEIFGNFYLYENLNILSGDNLKGNINLTNFNATDISYVYNNDLKIDSAKIHRNEDDVFFNDNFLTPCELDGYFNCPTWSLRIDRSKYVISEDKFIHYDTFLQIADYKVFYLPYFSHYGVKAPRKKGFLSPILEFNVGHNQAIMTPYYIPVGHSTDILFTPKFFFKENSNIFDKYELSTLINNKNSRGSLDFEIKNIKDNNNSNINSSIKINTKQIIDKKKIFSASGLFTNSISTTRSKNEDPISFEEIFIKLENYDFIDKNDYLKSEISTVESFDSSNSNSLPIIPSITYYNHRTDDELIFSNQINLKTIKRNNSSTSNPSEAISLDIQNEITHLKNFKINTISNKLIFNNSRNEYYFNENSELNSISYKSKIFLSSDFSFNSLNKITPRLKLIAPFSLYDNYKDINEDSRSLTFNYQNQFSENRFFGKDLQDTSPRFVYGIEKELNLSEEKIFIKINQSYDFNKNNNYANQINQKSNYSDYSIEAKTNFKDINFQIDSRINQNDFSRKEMNYSLNIINPLKLNIFYHETESEAYKDISNDTKALNFGLTKSINNNISIFYGVELDVKNNYDPYKSLLKLNLNDECSRLEVGYSNTRFNDNFNTKPEEKISINFYMDYLGFFGYEQSTNLFFQETGVFKSGQ